MQKSGSLTSSLEDYIEAIFEIIAERQAVRSKDIAERLNVSQPSVTGALRALSEKNLIRYQPYGVITLTDEGRGVARRVSGRHVLLRGFLTDILHVDEAEANKVACEMEHVMSEKVISRLESFVSYVSRHKEICQSWSFDGKPVKAKKKTGR